ncbi:MAG TPA: ABC transporter ATP-binding protein, partial [Gemmata sp.]|nr:ABC transporter ATP-binding protein [Gemmata sp.]
MGEPETVIRVENLSKRYVISHAAERGRYSTLRDTITQGTKSLVRRFTRRGEPGADPTREEFWALKDVSFEVKRGDVVGIIGRNGAGKSTLLKILSRITEPTTGRIAIDGRVASLLEVGTGFHPELTGRENVYLNGSILGMSRAEVKRKFDEIVAFAEIEKFLDTPVKRYSSGMYMRLAFAVAAHLEPEILIVDEVLAVGDAAFQKKCMGKMGEVAKGGRTVLFVSHNLGMVRHLCNTGVYLRRGTIESTGPIGPVIDQYQDTKDAHTLTTTLREKPSVVSVEVASDLSGVLKIDVGFHSPFPFIPLIGVIVSTREGQPLFGTNQVTHPVGNPQEPISAGIASAIVRGIRLHSGTYSVTVWLTDPDGT